MVLKNKIKFIERELFPLKSYINENSKESELYKWTEGDKHYYIRKDFIGNNELLEIYIKIVNIKTYQILGDTFIYKLPYNKGQCDFYDIGNYTCQIL